MLAEGLNQQEQSLTTMADLISSLAAGGKDFGEKHTVNEVISASERSSTELEKSQSNNPFLDPEVASHYAEVYEKAQYECRHEFDPSFTWTPQEEKKLVRRLDWHVCTWAVGRTLTGYIASMLIWGDSASCSLHCKSTAAILARLSLVQCSRI